MVAIDVPRACRITFIELRCHFGKQAYLESAPLKWVRKPISKIKCGIIKYFIFSPKNWQNAYFLPQIRPLRKKTCKFRAWEQKHIQIQHPWIGLENPFSSCLWIDRRNSISGYEGLPHGLWFPASFNIEHGQEAHVHGKLAKPASWVT